MMLSYGSAFANSGACASWLPWCAAATLDLVRARGARGRCGAGAAAAIAFGLQLLAGEPAISLLTVLFSALLGVAEVLSAERDRSRRAQPPRGRSRCRDRRGGARVAAPPSALRRPPPDLPRTAPLLGARVRGLPFAPWRIVEWLFPRFGGDPGALGAGSHWQFALHQDETRLHLVRDVRRDPARGRPDRGRAARTSGLAGPPGSPAALSSRSSSPSVPLSLSFGSSSPFPRSAASAIRSSSIC